MKNDIKSLIRTDTGWIRGQNVNAERVAKIRKMTEEAKEAKLKADEMNKLSNQIIESSKFIPRKIRNVVRKIRANVPYEVRSREWK